MALTRASAAVVKTEELVNNRNRIINGDMRIDQRNAGASVTPATFAFPVDRWRAEEDTDGAYTIEQVEDAPAGFIQSLKVTVTTTDTSIGATQTATLQQRIEGNNVADFGLGTANAKTFTLSFWVKSSLTGTFGGGFSNAAENRSFAFIYTISAADTWEYKTVTVAGDTTGTWQTGTSTGLRVNFGFAAGTTYAQNPGSWSADAKYFSALGAVNVLGTLNATWFVTGVQLEVGSVATPFERRPFGTELALCQRYFETFGLSSTSLIGGSYSTTAALTVLQWKVTKRVSPTITLPAAGQTSGTVSFLAANANYPATTGTHVTGGTTVDKAYIEGSSYVGLTLGATSTFYSNLTTTIQISAEL
jgi:hypothetical protein